MIGNMVFSTIANLAIFMILGRIILRVVAGALTIGDVVIFIATSANLRNLLENTTDFRLTSSALALISVCFSGLRL